jgi:Ras family protein T1
MGFLFLNTLFIQRGRLETTWTILRTFGYGDDLSLKEEFLFPPFPVGQDCSVELSPAGYQFFIELFQSYDKDKDGCLKPPELQDLFSTTPGNPWDDTDFPNTTVTHEDGITMQGFLAQWRFFM